MTIHDKNKITVLICTIITIYLNKRKQWLCYAGYKYATCGMPDYRTIVNFPNRKSFRVKELNLYKQ